MNAGLFSVLQWIILSIEVHVRITEIVERNITVGGEWDVTSHI